MADLAEFDPGAAELQSEAQFGLGLGQAARNALGSLWDFVKVPGDVYGGKYSLDEISRLAPGYALGLASGGTPVGAATVPENALGIFAGIKSATMSPTSLLRAQTLEKYRNTLNDINELSGWFRGPDKQWRYTISDEAARLNPVGVRPNIVDPSLVAFRSGETDLINVLSHPDLFAAYPELAKYQVHPMPFDYTMRGTTGAFNPERKMLWLSGGNPDRVLSSLLHETQHAVQNIEGFARGGGVEEFLPPGFSERAMNAANAGDLLRQDIFNVHPDFTKHDYDEIKAVLSGYMNDRVLSRLRPDLRNRAVLIGREAMDLRAQRLSAYDKYQRLAGEVEARAVQEQLARRDWTTPVWQHEGYTPFGEQIVLPQRGAVDLVSVDHDPFAMEFTPIDHDPFAEGASK